MTETLSHEIRTPIAKRIGSLLEQAGMLVVLLALVVFCSLTVRNFFSFNNLDSLLLAAATVGMISCTMLFCLASGNFDLSVGTLVPCAGVMAAVVLKKTTNLSPGMSMTLAIGAGLGIGALVGLVNGVVVAKLKINPLITTLATMQMVKGLALIISNGESVGISHDAFSHFGNAAFPVFKEVGGVIRFQKPFAQELVGKVIFQVTAQVWICFACFVIFGFLLRRTTFGRNTLAIGGNEEAARLAGIAVDRIKIVIFVLQGIVAALAGVIVASTLTLGQPKGKEGLELQVISACVLGGVSLTGGVGKMSFVIAGVFIMGVVQNAMDLKKIQPFWQYVVSGAILLTAVMLDRLKQHRS